MMGLAVCVTFFGGACKRTNSTRAMSDERTEHAHTRAAHLFLAAAAKTTKRLETRTAEVAAAEALAITALEARARKRAHGHTRHDQREQKF